MLAGEGELPPWRSPLEGDHGPARKLQLALEQTAVLNNAGQD